MSSPRANQSRTTTQDSVLTESLVLAKKLPLTTWNNLNPEPTIENQKKYHNKLMKPLQINNKRKLLTVASNKNHQKYIEEPLQEAGYEELISRVSEIKKISKHQDRIVGTPKKRDNGESHEYNLLRMNLSQDAMKTIELARENANATIQNESNSSRLYNSTVDQKDQNASSVEPTGRTETKQKRLATQLSNQMDKKVPKQLNSSAHFRHAKRKILLLRALDSVVNQKEIIKEAYSDVRSCREAAEHAPRTREHSIESYIPPSLSTIRPTSRRGRDAFETPVASKFALEIAQRPSFYLPSANLDCEQIGSFTDVATTKNIRLPLSENCINTTPKSKAKTVIISHKKSPVGSISNFLKDSEYFNSSQELEKSEANTTKPNNFDGRIMRMQTIDSVTYEFTKSQFAHSKSQFFVEDEALQASKVNFSGSRANRTQQKVKAEFQEQKDRAFRHELKLTMRNEPTSICGQASTITPKALRTSKSVNMLKHIRKVSASFENRSRRRDLGNTTSQSGTPRNRSGVEAAPSEASIVVHKLIRSGFRDDSVEKDVGKKEAEMILNSYGFKETGDILKKPRPKSRFLTLEGYQGAFLKEALAKTQRYMENVMKKDQKDKDF